VGLASYDELSLVFRSAKYRPYFHQALESDNHKRIGDDEIREDDGDCKYNDGGKSRTITPGDSQGLLILLNLYNFYSTHIPMMVVLRLNSPKIDPAFPAHKTLHERERVLLNQALFSYLLKLNILNSFSPFSRFPDPHIR
jgi:hypothetical protein